MWRKKLHVFDTSDSNIEKGKENKNDTESEKVLEDDEAALEYLAFDLIDEDVVL